MTTPKRRTLEEIQDWLDSKDVEHGLDEPWYRSECDKCLAAALREAADAARQERDFEWWQELALVDNVAPTPEAVKKWLLHLSAYEQQGARREEWEALLVLAEKTLSEMEHLKEPQSRLIFLVDALRRRAFGCPLPR